MSPFSAVLRRILTGPAALLLLVSLAAGCSPGGPPLLPAGSTTTPGSTPDSMQWNFAPGALVLHIKADPQLNFADDQAHTLRLCVYQVDKLDVFNEKAATSEGLAELMQCRSFDKSVKDVQSQIIVPGQVETQSLDRAEGAKHVAAVAGYYHLEPGMVSRTWSVPAAIYEEGAIFRTRWYYPGPLEMILLFGPSSLQRFTQPVQTQ